MEYIKFLKLCCANEVTHEKSKFAEQVHRGDYCQRLAYVTLCLQVHVNACFAGDKPYCIILAVTAFISITSL